jgi:hypothetical protein
VESAVYNFNGGPAPSQPQADGSLLFTPAADLVRIALAYRRPFGSARMAGPIRVSSATLETVK